MLVRAVNGFYPGFKKFLWVEVTEVCLCQASRFLHASVEELDRRRIPRFTSESIVELVGLPMPFDFIFRGSKGPYLLIRRVSVRENIFLGVPEIVAVSTAVRTHSRPFLNARNFTESPLNARRISFHGIIMDSPAGPWSLSPAFCRG